MQRSLSTLLAASCLLGAPPVQLAAQAPTLDHGVYSLVSDTTFAATLERVGPAVTGEGLFVMRVIDHAAAAAQFGQELAPNTVYLFGTPAVGSRLMNCSPRVGMDLPQKLIVWEADGRVHVAWNDPMHLKERHAITGCDELLERVAATLGRIGRAVAGTIEG